MARCSPRRKHTEEFITCAQMQGRAKFRIRFAPKQKENTQSLLAITGEKRFLSGWKALHGEREARWHGRFSTRTENLLQTGALRLASNRGAWLPPSPDPTADLRLFIDSQPFLWVGNEAL